MAVYYINFLLIIGLAYPLCIRKPCNVKIGVYLLITFSWMWVIATFRYGIGFDYYSYIRIFEQIRGTQNLAALLALRYEPGFALLTGAMTFFIADTNITANAAVMYGVYQVFILLPAMWFIYRYSKENAWLATWLYATLTFFYTSMNFTRQALACSVSLLGYKYLRERKLIPYMLIVLLAASFHVTALIMVPIYFICQIRLTKKLAIFYGVSVAVLFLSSNFILDFVTQFVFATYRDTLWLNEHLTARFLFVPAAILATCLVLLKGWEKRDSDAVMLTNMMMFSFVIWLFSTRHFILERFSMYPYIFVMVALPAAISALRASEKDRMDFAALKESTLDAPTGGKKKKAGSDKDALSRRGELAKNIKEREAFYWSAVVGIFAVTLVYHSMSVHVGDYGFHNIFPYSSVLEWLGGMVPRSNIFIPA